MMIASSMKIWVVFVFFFLLFGFLFIKITPVEAAVQIRQEINLIDSVVSSPGTNSSFTAPEQVGLDTSQYNGTVTAYLELIWDGTCGADTSGQVDLVDSGGTSHITMVGPCNASYVRTRSAGTLFNSTNFPTGTYKIKVTDGFSAPSTSFIHRVKAARLIITQNASSLTSSETQIEIGNAELAKTNTTTAALSSPKYWTYTSANWDGNPKYYAEITYKTSTTQTVTAYLQEDDGSFSTWSNILTIVSAVSNQNPTRIRSSATFTPTATGRHYRIVTSESSSSGGRNYSIYNAKIIIDQNVIVDSSAGDATLGPMIQGGTGVSQAGGNLYTVGSSGFDLASYDFKITKVASPSDSLYAEVASSLGGAAIATSNTVASSFTSGDYVTFTFSPTVPLSASTNYYFRLYRTGARDTTNYYNIPGDPMNPVTKVLTNSSGSWTLQSGLPGYKIRSATPITLLEPQYLLLNTKSLTTGVQSFQTLWDSTEWSGVLNVYTHAQDAIGSSANVQLVDINNSNTAIQNSSITGANQQISTGLTMPTSGHELDTSIIAVGTEVDASRILVAVTIQSNPTKIAFSNSARTLTAGACNGDVSVFTMQLQNDSGSAVNPLATTVVRVTSNSTGTFTVYTDNTCATTAPSGDFTFTTSDSSKSVYVVDTKSSSPSWTISGTRQSGDTLTTGTQSYTVNPDIVANFQVTIETPQVVNTCFTGTNTIAAYDAWGNLQTSDASVVNMTTSGNGISFYSSIGCSGLTTSYTLAGGTSPIYVKGVVGQSPFYITATKSSSIENGTSGAINIPFASSPSTGTVRKLQGPVKIQGNVKF